MDLLDDRGRPVRGLGAQGCALSEDGKPPAIVSFEAIDLGKVPRVEDEVAGPTRERIEPLRITHRRG